MKHKSFFLIIFLVFIFSIACTTSPQEEENKSNDNETGEFVTPDPSKSFVGSASCKGNDDCHIHEYLRWSKSKHAKFLLNPVDNSNVMPDSDYNGIDDFKQGIALGDTTNIPNNDSEFLTRWRANVSPVLSYNNTDGYYINIKNKTYAINYVIGSKRQQLFLTKIDSIYYLLPIQYNTKNNLWQLYDTSAWYNNTTPVTPNNNRSWEKNCSGCHTTGLVFAGKNNKNEYVTVYNELNIGCESCHGSGKEHVSSNNKKGNILNPKKLTFNEANSICGACHSRGSSVSKGTFSFPFNDTSKITPFTPGENLENYFVLLNTNSWNDFNKTNKNNHSQYNEFSGSSHESKGVTCFDCHDPHYGEYMADLKSDPNDNSLCINSTCHSVENTALNKLSGITSNGNISGHTKHKVDSLIPSKPTSGDGSKCISCHMPYTAKSLQDYDLPNHSFSILYPSENNVLNSERPNSCMNRNCHTSKDESVNKWVSSNKDDNKVATNLINGLWGNIAPVANVENNLIGIIDSTVILNGDNSFDPNDTTTINLSYKWLQILGPANVIINNANSSKASFKSSFAGKYIFELLLSDGALSSSSKKVEVIIKR